MTAGTARTGAVAATVGACARRCSSSTSLPARPACCSVRCGWPHWRTVQPHLLGGSSVALTTGLLVAQTGSPLAWVLPALLGQVPIALAERRLAGAAPA